MPLNIDLLKQARATLLKRGFVPSDPAAGGGAPPDAGGGAPPDAGVGAPPMPDAGGAPPPDGGGAAPPPPPGPPPDAGVGGGPPGGDIAAQVAQGVQQAMMMTGMQGQGPGTGKPTAPKPDINTIATDVFQLKKMFFHVCRINNWELPPDILDGPNRDPMTGAPAMGPTGGSDAQPGSSMQQAGGMQSAIKPIQPMQGAFPAPGGGGMGKTSAAHFGEEITSRRVMSKAAAMAMILRRQRALRGE